MRLTLRKNDTVELASSERRRFSMMVETTGCTIIGKRDGADVLLFAGVGVAQVRGVIEGNEITVTMNNPGITVLDIPELRADFPEWIGGESYTDLEPRPITTIAPEIQAVIERMNRNAIIREQALLRSLGQRDQ